MSKQLLHQLMFAVAVSAFGATNAFAGEGSGLNETQKGLADVAGQAAVDNCPCPEADASTKEVDRYTKCIKKGASDVLKAFKTAQKFVGAPTGPFKSEIVEAVRSYDEDCRASREDS